MTDKLENPPAFACAAENGHQQGMTLRDYYEGKVLAGLITAFYSNRPTPIAIEEAPNADWVARLCRYHADAMLKAREND